MNIRYFQNKSVAERNANRLKKTNKHFGKIEVKRICIESGFGYIIIKTNQYVGFQKITYILDTDMKFKRWG